jgi:succinate dehydrogenase / fumarate reductase iron-sulfur subunit
MSQEIISLNLKIWRQNNSADKGRFEDYKLDGISTHMSFLEMLDVLNEKLIHEGKDPVVFDHDCREGICGTCSMVINGNPHGPNMGTTTCQLHMRFFQDGETVVVEPFRARAFPVIKDLMINRSAFDRIQQAGGYVSVNTGSAQDGNSILVPKQNSDEAFEAAECIGCGACVASCKNASAMLFVASKVSQFALLPQGAPERSERAMKMLAAMDAEGFGACSTTGTCSASCPKGISLSTIARFNREFAKAKISSKPPKEGGGGAG